MAFDALSLSVLAQEFSQMLVGGKITKIYQPERDEIVLFVFNKKNYKLVVSANAGVNRIHITDNAVDNPKIAPSFCMLLRKRITNATITDVYQMPFERVLDFSLSATDDLGYKSNLHLIFELTGKTSNIILTDENYVIAESIKHLPQDLDSARILVPGTKYTFFPPRKKIAPFNYEKIQEFLSTCSLPLRRALTETLLGVSQTTVNEMLFGIDENDHSLLNVLKVIEGLKQYEINLKNKKPCVISQKGVPVEVLPFDYLSKKGERTYFETLNEAHDAYYYLTDKVQRFNDKAKSVSTIVKNAISRTEKKLAAQRQSVLEAEHREQFRQFGDLITANIWQLKKGSEQLNCDNFYDGTTVSIQLDKTLTPQQNAQNYYKKYRKLKSSAEHNSKLVEENQKLLTYLLTIKQNLQYCTELDDLQQIREELISLGLIKEKTKQKNKETPMRPLHYVIDGHDVFVGKNNLQNAFVTFKLAKSDDVWLHAQKIHSAHVVIVKDNSEIAPSTILTAAEICAFFSQAGSGSKIPIDYTVRQNVKRPSGSTPGFAVYNVYKTVIVDPNRHTNLLL